MKYFLSVVFILWLYAAGAQLKVHYDPSVQSGSIQYFKPKGDLFVGDCIPFYHQGTYFLYWLLDSAHHSALKGLGGHQWAVSTSTNLIDWKHYPVVLGIDEDWEKSICTGSVFFYKDVFYAFYATRLVDKDGKVKEQLSYAKSKDGIKFVKQQPNPFFTHSPGYSERNFRDPKVIVDSAGTFHLFISSSTDVADTLKTPSGALVHLVSKDLKNWQALKSLISGQDDVPECPDYFYWNGWYYLVYGRGGSTFYLKSRQKYGPWEYPSSQALNEDWVNVVKTAEFKNNRRIAAGWIPNKRDNKDDGREIFGGNIVLREVIQNKDGTLTTAFVKETLPKMKRTIPFKLQGDTILKNNGGTNYSIKTPNGFAAAKMVGLPQNYRLTLEVEPSKMIEKYGLKVRADQSDPGYEISFSPTNREVQLRESKILAVDGLDKKIKLDVIVRGDIADVSVNGQRCIINRIYEKAGDGLWLFAKHGSLNVSNVQLVELEESNEN